MQAHNLIFLSCLLLFLSAASSVTLLPEPAPMPGGVLGGYAPIKNLSEPHVKEVARFAVAEHNKQNKAQAVHLLKVVEGWTQVVAGINYHLIIAVRPVHQRRVVHLYHVFVYERPWTNTMRLTSFIPVIQN